MHSTCALAMQYTLKYIKDILILLSTVSIMELIGISEQFTRRQIDVNWLQKLTIRYPAITISTIAVCALFAPTRK